MAKRTAKSPPVMSARRALGYLNVQAAAHRSRAAALSADAHLHSLRACDLEDAIKAFKEKRRPLEWVPIHVEPDRSKVDRLLTRRRTALCLHRGDVVEVRTWEPGRGWNGPPGAILYALFLD